MAARIRYFADSRLTPLAVPIETLELDPDNELDHTEASVQEIVKLLVRFGWREPVGALKSRRKVKIVIRGNRTLMAARWLAEAAASEDLELRERAIGHESWWTSAEPPDWLMAPALFFADDDATRTAWRISHNKSAAAPAWDWGILAVNMAEVSDEIDWGELGWSAEELAELFEDEADEEDEAGPGGGDANEEPPIPEVPAEPVTKRGEVIQLGPHVLHCEDCMVVMAGMADNSVDFIGTDGPYGLSPDGKARTWDDLDELRRLRHKCQDRCPTHVVGLADIGDTDDADPEAEQERVTVRVRLSARSLMLGAVEFDDGRQGWKVEVDDDRPVAHVEDLLVREWDLALREEVAKGQLGLWVREGLSGCVGTCSCATECSHPFVGVLVGLRHDALGETKGAPNVVAAPRAELRAVLRFHVGGRSADLLPARGASDVDPVLFLGRPDLVGARAAAGGLTPVFEADGLGEVGDAAGGALAFDLLAAGVLVGNSTHDPSVKRVGFMSRTWDAGVPGLKWARECLRILKPGGHLVSFSANRTYHRHACAVEDAGFAIREMFDWLNWSGFPKSKNMSLAIDEMLGREREVVRTPMGPTGNKYAKGLGDDRPWMQDAAEKGYHEHPGNEPASELAATWDGFGTALKSAKEPAVVARKPLDSIAPAEVADLLGQPHMWNRKALDSDEKRKAAAKRWTVEIPDGAVEWRGRPLLPGVEGRLELRVGDEVLASLPGPKYSKAAISTVAVNVLKWGTGAINIDAGRFEKGDPAWPGPSGDYETANPSFENPNFLGAKERDGTTSKAHDLGRWPANIYATPKPARSEKQAGCEQLPTEDGFESTGRVKGSAGSKHARAGRVADGVGNNHNTVKPKALFSQLLRLFCPPGGTAFEPFGGSGTTLVAASGLDCKVIACELDPGYSDIIRARVEWALKPDAGSPPRKPGKRRKAPEDGNKRQARRRVQTLIQSGKLKRPADVTCVDCEDAPGREYDHHLGYGAAHHEDVEALCAGCHHKREAERERVKAET